MLTEMDRQLARQLLENNLIDFDQMKSCLDQYNQIEGGPSFPQYLVEKGIVTSEQLAPYLPHSEGTPNSEDDPWEVETLVAPSAEFSSPSSKTNLAGKTGTLHSGETKASDPGKTDAAATGHNHSHQSDSSPTSDENPAKTNHTPRAEETPTSPPSNSPSDQTAVDPHSPVQKEGHPSPTDKTMVDPNAPIRKDGGTGPIGVGTDLGDFALESLLGKGGMGAVYLGHQKSLGRKVAVKVISVAGEVSPDFVARFVREARLAAQLAHPNVIQIYQIGETHGQKYIVMEYVQGHTLKDVIRREESPDLKTVVEVLLQATKGLAAAHQRGILHRDIKPDNIFIDEEGNVKLADFGLAKQVETSGEGDLTQPGMMVGTPFYMSPEQIEGGDVDERSDLYSIGATFFHSISGRPPFSGKSTMQILFQHCHDPVKFPDELRDRLPDLAMSIIEKCMAKPQDDRYSSARELLEDLQELWKNLEFAGSSSPPPSRLDATMSEPHPTGFRPDETAAEPRPHQDELGATMAEPQPSPAGNREDEMIEELPTMVQPHPEAQKTGTARHRPKPEVPTPPKSTGDSKKDAILANFKKQVAEGNFVTSDPPKAEKTPQGSDEMPLPGAWSWEGVVQWLRDFGRRYQSEEDFRLEVENSSIPGHQLFPVELYSRGEARWNALWIDDQGIFLLEDMAGKLPDFQGETSMSLSSGSQKGPLYLLVWTGKEKFAPPIRNLSRDRLQPGNTAALEKAQTLVNALRDQGRTGTDFFTSLVELEVT